MKYREEAKYTRQNELATKMDNGCKQNKNNNNNNNNSYNFIAPGNLNNCVTHVSDACCMYKKMKIDKSGIR